jgi:hypothetical protein
MGVRSLGANLGATRADDFSRHTDACGRACGHHPSPRTDPDDAERRTGIYGSDGWVRVPQSVWARLAVRIVAGAVVARRVTAQLLTLRP